MAVERPKTDAGWEENARSRFQARIDIERPALRSSSCLCAWARIAASRCASWASTFFVASQSTSAAGICSHCELVKIVIAHAVAVDVVFAHEFKAAILQHQLIAARGTGDPLRRLISSGRWCRGGEAVEFSAADPGIIRRRSTTRATTIKTWMTRLTGFPGIGLPPALDGIPEVLRCLTGHSS